MTNRKNIHNAAVNAARANARNIAASIPEEYRGWKLECHTCKCTKQVLSSRTVNSRFDATEVYTLECGHTVI